MALGNILPLRANKQTGVDYEIKCPVCHRWQPFLIGEDEYTIGNGGIVWPSFVCMSGPPRCSYMATIKVRIED